MALSNCFKCGSSISTSASRCPKCQLSSPTDYDYHKKLIEEKQNAEEMEKQRISKQMSEFEIIRKIIEKNSLETKNILNKLVTCPDCSTQMTIKQILEQQGCTQCGCSEIERPYVYKEFTWILNDYTGYKEMQLPNGNYIIVNYYYLDDAAMKNARCSHCLHWNLRKNMDWTDISSPYDDKSHYETQCKDKEFCDYHKYHKSKQIHKEPPKKTSFWSKLFG